MWYPGAGEKGERLKNSWMGRLFPASTTIAKTLCIVVQGRSIVAWKLCTCGILFSLLQDDHKSQTTDECNDLKLLLNSSYHHVRFNPEILVSKAQNVCFSSNPTESLLFTGARHMH